MVQYNNAPEKGRIVRKGAILPDGGAMLPDGYFTSIYTWLFAIRFVLYAPRKTNNNNHSLILTIIVDAIFVSCGITKDSIKLKLN